jgi:hypothetical protein
LVGTPNTATFVLLFERDNVYFFIEKAHQYPDYSKI